MHPLRLLPFTRMLPIRLPYGVSRGGSTLPLLIAAGIGLFAARPDLMQRMSQDPKNMGTYLLLGVAVIGFLGAAARSFGAFVQLAFWGALVVYFGQGIIPLPAIKIPSLAEPVRPAEPVAFEDVEPSHNSLGPGEYVDFDARDRERRGSTRAVAAQPAQPATSGTFTDPSITDMLRRFDEDTSALKSPPAAKSPFGTSAGSARRDATSWEGISAMLGNIPGELRPDSKSDLPDSAYFPPPRRNNTGLNFLQRR